MTGPAGGGAAAGPAPTSGSGTVQGLAERLRALRDGTAQVAVPRDAATVVLLRDTPAEQIDTTLIIHPEVLTDFLDYNDFLDNADATVEALDLGGILQVASFHPDYQFEGTHIDDPSNCTNRAPYPTLHLLREDSVERAVAAFPDPDVIVERNIATLDKLGSEGFKRLLAGDLVLAIDGAPLGDAQSLQKRLFTDAIGQRMEVTVIRNGALLDAVVLPSELPD